MRRLQLPDSSRRRAYDPGKEETIRHFYGDLLVGLPGVKDSTEAIYPEGKEKYYICRRVVNLGASETLTLPPGEKHWFQGGKRGAVAFSFSTAARDVFDRFSDPDVVGTTRIVEAEWGCSDPQ